MNIPQHIGIIMDGNGRWARKRGLPRTMGHRAGTDATRRVVRACGEVGVGYLTIYVFSAENWDRPKREVGLLMDLLVEMIHREVKELNKNNVRLHAIGNLSRLPEKTRVELQRGMEETSNNSGLNLVLAVSYGGRDDIVQAARSVAREAVKDPSIADSLDEATFSRYLYTSPFPDPELIIRTGGERRISNFLIWPAAYAEFYHTDTLWPDFGRDELMGALEDYNQRERRFGRVLEPE